MITKNTNIRGFAVEFENDGETTQCFIQKGNLSGSLELLAGTGCLTDNCGDDHRIASDIIDAIEKWALAQGY